MRGVLKGLSSAYVLFAALFGGGILMFGNNFQHQNAVLAGNFSTWVSSVELRATPPQSINFRIAPLRLPLRGSLLEDRPLAPQPLAPNAHPNTLPDKPKSSRGYAICVRSGKSCCCCARARPAASKPAV